MLPKPVTIVTSESSTCFVRPEDFGFGAGLTVTTQTPAQVPQHSDPPNHSIVFHQKGDKMSRLLFSK